MADQPDEMVAPCRARTMRTALTKTPCKWWLLRLSNLSTILREWAAVHSLGQMAMQNVLLTAKVRLSSDPAHAECMLRTFIV